MRDINTVALGGRITRDPETRYTQNGTAILNFSIANNQSKKVGDEWVDEASFFDCVLFGKLAEIITPRMTKGAEVFLTGRLRQDRWESEGAKRSKVVVNVDEIRVHGKSDAGSEPSF